MEQLKTIRWKPSDVGKDVAGFAAMLDHRYNEEVIVRKGKKTAVFLIYVKSERS